MRRKSLTATPRRTLLLPAAPEPPNQFRRQTKKRRQPFDPLFKQLLAVDEDERVHTALSNQPRRDDGLSERSGRRENPRIVLQHGLRGRPLFGT
jgi:hypothetical protein